MEMLRPAAPAPAPVAGAGAGAMAGAGAGATAAVEIERKFHVAATQLPALEAALAPYLDTCTAHATRTCTEAGAAALGDAVVEKRFHDAY